MKRHFRTITSGSTSLLLAMVREISWNNPTEVFVKIYRHFMTDSLYRNSIYLILSTAVLAFLGFFFWIINARLYTPEEVGIATTLISVMTFISNFSLLGFNVALIRYLPKSSNRNRIINSVLVLIFSASLIGSIIFIAGIKLFSPKLLFLQHNILYIISFCIFIVGASLNTIAESIFMAYRASFNVLIKNGLLSILKLIGTLLFVFLGSYGIFSSVALATLISALGAFILLILRYKYYPSFEFNKKIIKDMATFSGGNFIAGFSSQTPTLILPLLIINILNAKIAAYYYIDAMILGFLAIIPSAVTQSLLAEGSYDNTKLKQQYIKSIKIISTLLLPTILIIVLFGNIILHFFGKNYANEAFTLLRIISFSAIFMSVISIGNSILRVRHQIAELIIANFLSAIFILAFSYLFMHLGLTGEGIGWFIGQALSALLYIVILGKAILIRNLRDILNRFSHSSRA
ncbi:MAG TPA: oligosaccharide flippase family protein [Candidatus Sulfotelmatobacter sp.]|nr:oligosaccharide flippase family protein [Candidatus Sulfotelmatobacter sp.]